MSTLGEGVQAVDFDHPFTIVDGTVTDVDPNVYAPSVYFYAEDTSDDALVIDGAGNWETVSDGWTGQYGYNGPVMHASEYIGERIAEELAEMAEDYLAFAIVAVEVIPEDESAHGYEDEPAGWAIVGLRK